MRLKQLPVRLRNFLFVVLQPGIVAGVIPYIIERNGLKNELTHTFLFHHYFGIAMFLAGTFIMFHCIVRFPIQGLGTLSPADPTKKLIVSGLYRFSRNPMYVGVILILLGEVVFSLSGRLFLYSAGVFVLFNLFIVYREEPRLTRDFGQDYEIYRGKVRRWF